MYVSCHLDGTALGLYSLLQYFKVVVDITPRELDFGLILKIAKSNSLVVDEERQ
jgi:hypothetical protein